MTGGEELGTRVKLEHLRLQKTSPKNVKERREKKETFGGRDRDRGLESRRVAKKNFPRKFLISPAEDNPIKELGGETRKRETGGRKAKTGCSKLQVGKREETRV